MTDVSVTTNCDNIEVVNRSIQLARVDISLFDDLDSAFVAQITLIDTVDSPNVACEPPKTLLVKGATYTAFINSLNTSSPDTLRNAIDEHVTTLVQAFYNGSPQLPVGDVTILDFDLRALLQRVFFNLTASASPIP